MREILTQRRLQLLSCVMDMSDKEIGERLNCTRMAIHNSRKRHGLFGQRSDRHPKCPHCGTRTNYLKDEGVAFCPNCCARVNARGELVDEKLRKVS